jgi:hypothetical protein
MNASKSSKLQAIIDKMMNCTATEHQDLTGVVYGDYMDVIEYKVFIESTDLSGVDFIK